MDPKWTQNGRRAIEVEAFPIWASVSRDFDMPTGHPCSFTLDFKLELCNQPNNSTNLPE